VLDVDAQAADRGPVSLDQRLQAGGAARLLRVHDVVGGEDALEHVEVPA
jgi:hypothetical protein